MSTPAENGSRSAGRELILIVEDEPGIVDFVSRGLKTEGFDVVSAADGRAGILTAESEPVDLVVLDVMLPETRRPDRARPPAPDPP